MSVRRWGAALLASTAALAAIELCCCWFFRTFQERFTFYDRAALTLPPEKYARAARIFSPELGWLRKFDTPFGERPRARDYGRPLLATFGDSYTFGEQVGDKQTYQHYLARRLRADIYNFGQGGYGTDQAYLYFQQRYPQVETPLVSLGLITENINRIVNVFRPYYYSKTALALSKPRLELVGGTLRLIPNPVQDLGDIPKLTDVNFIRRLGAHDWWYGRERGPELTFPYTAILLNRRLWLEAFYGRGSAAIDDIDPRPWEDLWDDPHARTLLYAIIDAFTREARARGAAPLVILSPRVREVAAKIAGQDSRGVTLLLEFCRQRGYHCFDGVSALAAHARSVERLPALYSGHLSPYGNKVFADALAQWLIEKGLVQAQKERARGAAAIFKVQG